MIYIRKLFSAFKTSKFRSQLMLLGQNNQNILKDILAPAKTYETIYPFRNYKLYPVYNTLFAFQDVYENDISHIKHSNSVHVIELSEADEFNLSTISEVESINLSCSFVSV